MLKSAKSAISVTAHAAFNTMNKIGTVENFSNATKCLGKTLREFGTLVGTTTRTVKNLTHDAHDFIDAHQKYTNQNNPDKQTENEQFYQGLHCIIDLIGNAASLAATGGKGVFEIGDHFVHMTDTIKLSDDNKMIDSQKPNLIEGRA